MKAGEALCPGHADAPPTPQPSAPVVACKAPEWCGFVQGDRKDPRRQRYIEDMSPNEGVYVGTHCYCSSACVPPLAAKPAEATACCDRGTLGCDAGYRDDGRLHSHRQFCKEQTRAKAAEQFKPAKGHDFSDPYCARRYEGAVVRLCVACGAFDVEGMRAPACEAKNWRPGYEGWLGGHEHGILRDPAIPERIVKPQMAHSMGIEDPALEDA
jgi:hypothetical protein